MSKATTTTTAVPNWLAVTYALCGAGLLQLLYRVCQEAYTIRMYAVREFGRVIHEFDPYFNYRATVYLYDHGWKAFSQWFDYMVWYPLGRPVGTTIYPGMQVTSVWIKNHLLPDWSVNDICVFVPAWFGVTATLCAGWLTYECSREQEGSLATDIPGVKQLYELLLLPIGQFGLNLLEKMGPTSSAWGFRSEHRSPLAPYVCAVAAAAIMSVVPAHLLRSIAGGYDNESIAMTAMLLTFSTWTCSLRPLNNLYLTTALGVATGLAYFYMVAAWGGYVFVINLLAAHAGLLVLLGRYSQRLHRSYSAMYVVGTALAIQIPVVGWTPLKSLEQMAPLLAFGGLQLIEVVEVLKVQRGWNTQQTWKARIALVTAAAAVAALVAAALASTGYFGPISSRVRGLFVKHTKTGNPLVDSVAEHQAASSQAYFQYLHYVCYLLPLGMAWTVLRGFGDASSFLVVYAAASYYFSLKMVRLILLTAPIASCLGGIAIGRVLCYGLNAIVLWQDVVVVDDNNVKQTAKAQPVKATKKKTKKGAKYNRQNSSASETEEPKKENEDDDDSTLNTTLGLVIRAVRVGLVLYLIRFSIPFAKEFFQRSHEVAEQISHPTIIQKARTRNGDQVLVDDYREAYQWIAENTPEDARIMAWWDYGYQITGIGNRTTIADGNTWNHEHIALLGRILTAPEKEAHRIARHLADYVLVWAGGGGDDLAKSPHLRRIANSVYRGLCREPTCQDFGFYSDHTPTKDMNGCLLHVLHSNGLKEGVEVDRNRFREVYTSKYRKVRIYKILSVSKESKEWVINNRKCDAPGSWFCPGQYPPALKTILEQKSDFAQLEDFNRGTKDDEYTKEYFENLNKKKTHGSVEKPQVGVEANKQRFKKLAPEYVEKLNEKWEDNAVTTKMWDLISQNDLAGIRDFVLENPAAVHVRSQDGRGPMWWAHEYGRKTIISMLQQLGVSEKLEDANGMTPLDIPQKTD